jgi:hypothetical protein
VLGRIALSWGGPPDNDPPIIAVIKRNRRQSNVRKPEDEDEDDEDEDEDGNHDSDVCHMKLNLTDRNL